MPEIRLRCQLVTFFDPEAMAIRDWWRHASTSERIGMWNAAQEMIHTGGPPSDEVNRLYVMRRMGLFAQSVMAEVMLEVTSSETIHDMMLEG